MANLATVMHFGRMEFSLPGEKSPLEILIFFSQFGFFMFVRVFWFHQSRPGGTGDFFSTYIEKSYFLSFVTELLLGPWPQEVGFWYVDIYGLRMVYVNIHVNCAIYRCHLFGIFLCDFLENKNPRGDKKACWRLKISSPRKSLLTHFL